jgi:PIN domain nuclease of toxin-antitoxin system
MNILLDTHVLIWWATDDPKLADPCRHMLIDPNNDVFFSSISIWEVAIKHAKGLLRLPPDLLRVSSQEAGLLEVAFSAAHAERVGDLPSIHGDPFDRALIAQALVHPFILVSQDEMIRRYPVTVKSF